MATSIFNSWVMQVTSTTDATSLKALMNTATAGAWTLAQTQKCNYIILNPETTIRATLDGQTPTAAVGLELLDANVYHFNWTTVDKVMLINAWVVNVQVGWDDTI